MPTRLPCSRPCLSASSISMPGRTAACCAAAKLIIMPIAIAAKAPSRTAIPLPSLNASGIIVRLMRPLHADRVHDRGDNPPAQVIGIALAVRIDAVGEHDGEDASGGVDPDHRTGEAEMAIAAGGKSGKAVGAAQVPAKPVYPLRPRRRSAT